MQFMVISCVMIMYS